MRALCAARLGAIPLAAMLLGGTLLAGCESYTERVSCTNGRVLNDDGDCVPPPVPDGGVSIDSCATLCAMIPSWTDTQVMCLQSNLSLAGPLPTECQTLTTEAECDACVTAAGATDPQCQLASSCL